MTTIDAAGSRRYAEELVDALSQATDGRPGHRVSHVKGILLTGSFTASDRARELTVAGHMQGAPVPVLARFSNASTDPHSSDAAIGQPRGMSVRFFLDDGSCTDLVCQSWPLFIVRTPAEFLEFMQAQIESPEALGAFIADHPSTAAALQVIGERPQPPRSWATMAFHSSVSYYLVDAAGRRRAVRWQFAPVAGQDDLSEDECASADPDYLMTEARARLPIRFRVLVQLAQDGDAIDDCTVQWPFDREWVDMGQLDLTAEDTETERHGDVLVMDPMRVTPGIEPSDDPILHIRTHAYAVSAERRRGGAADASGD